MEVVWKKVDKLNMHTYSLYDIKCKTFRTSSTIKDSIGGKGKEVIEFSKIYNKIYKVAGLYFLGKMNNKYNFFMVCLEDNSCSSWHTSLSRAYVYALSKSQFTEFYNFIINMGVQVYVLKYQGQMFNGLLDRNFCSVFDAYFAKLKLCKIEYKISSPPYNSHNRCLAFKKEGYILGTLSVDNEKYLCYKDIVLKGCTHPYFDDLLLYLDDINFLKLFTAYIGGL